VAVHDSDGVAETLDHAVGLAVSLAGRVAEQRVRERERQLREARAESTQVTRQLQGRIDSQRSAAVAELQAVGQPQWWDHAQPSEIAHAWETAQAFQDLDPRAEQAAAAMRTQLRQRYGLDVDRPQPGEEPTRAQPAAADPAAAAVGSGAERENLQSTRAGAGYDTPQRRSELARDLAAKGIAADAVQARVLADVSQGTPARAAVAEAPRREASARRGARGPQRDRDRAR